MLKHIAVAAVLMAIAAPVYAGTPVLDRREHNQVQRIKQGARSGELTRVETRSLMKGQVQLRRMEHRAKSDGEVTGRERARLQKKANVESRKIYRQKHDRQRRG